jgi:DNA-binding HxlR family transcriptional regulator
MHQSIDPHCQAYQSAIEILCRPWTALILGVLQEGPLRFNELADRTHGLGTKTLSARLKYLDAHGIVVRHVEPGPPVRVQYALSAKGEAFRSVAQAIETWGRALVAEDSSDRMSTPSRSVHKKAASPR